MGGSSDNPTWTDEARRQLVKMRRGKGRPAGWARVAKALGYRQSECKAELARIVQDRLDELPGSNQITFRAILDRLKQSRFADDRDIQNERVGKLGGTPETCAKVKPDQVIKMLKAGAISRTHWAAAERLCEIMDGFQRAMYAQRSEGIETGRVQGGRSDVVTPLERIGVEGVELFTTAYIPWSKKALVPVIEGRRVTVRELVSALVVDNRSANEVIDLYDLPIDEKRFAEIIRGSLGDLARILKKNKWL